MSEPSYIIPAKGITGHLLRGPDGQYDFRVYDKHHNFVDYELTHFDLMVTIMDDDASFYTHQNGTTCLDHNPETSGHHMKTEPTLLSAKDALKITRQTINDGDEDAQRYLKEIFSFIEASAKKGKTTISRFNCVVMPVFVYNKLTALGYSVTSSDSQRDGYSVTISWG